MPAVCAYIVTWSGRAVFYKLLLVVLLAEEGQGAAIDCLAEKAAVRYETTGQMGLCGVSTTVE